MRKQFSTYRWVMLVLAVMLIVGAGHQAYSAKPASGALTVQVFVDFGTFDLRDGGAGTGPFYVGGAVADPASGETLGEFQCWGWFFTPNRNVVTQEYNIGSRGKIILGGIEDGGLRAIIGGTGDFRNVRGQAAFDFSSLNTDSSFLASFQLIGADK